MSTDDVGARVLSLVRKHLRFPSHGDGLSPDAELERLGLDSQSAISLLLDLESEFGVVFPDELLTAAIFRTPRSLEQAVRGLIAA